GGACDTYTIGDGGDGGGGDGGVNTTGVAGTDGTGGGGGGSGDHPNVGGDGGDGVVIISYITPLYSGVYRSPEVDLTDTYDLDSIGWTGYGSDSGGGETPHSTTGLVGKWDFNETSGTTADNEGSGTCDGTLSGMTTTGQDVVAGSGWTSNNRRWGDGALMFDGDNDYVTAGSDASIDNISAKTISFWLKVDSYSGDMHIINKGEVWFVAIDQPNSRYIFGQAFSTSNGRWSVPLSAVSVKEWHNIVVTYDRSSTSNNPLWYVDGISIPMTEYNPPSGSPNSDATGNLLLGDSPGYSRHYEGIMDTVSLYSRILTSSEILSNYNSGNIEFRSRTSTDGTSWTDWSGSETSLTNEYYKTVTIESDQVDSTLTNFPVLVSVTHNDYKSTANGGHVAQPDGGDIYFTNSAGTTQYDHEIEKYVPSTGQVIAWVEVPSVSSSADTTFRMYYGDNYSVDKWDVNGTWDSDYERVYHVNDSLDDSASSTTATNSGSTNTTSGHIADGRNFDGTDDYFYTTNLGYPDNVTVSAWINYDTLPSIYGHIVSQGRDGPSSGYHLSLLSDGSVHFAVNTNIAASPEISLSSSILTQGIWYHVVGTYDGSVGNLYINGSLASTSTITAADILYSYSEVLVVGKMSYNHSQPIIYFPFDGQVDEVRVSSKGRSAAWADASCNNQQPSSTFISFGTENTVSSSSELSFPEDSSIQIEYDDDAVSTTPVLHYTLDDTNGDLAGNDIFDSSGNDNDGEINGTTVQDGVIGYSRYLDGIDDAIVLSSPATLPTGNEITVAFWAKGLDSNSTASYLFTAEDSSSNRVMNIHLPWTDGNVYWDAGNSGTSSYDRTSKAISESEYRNKWVHWAFTKDASAGTLKIYLDGALWHSSTGHTRTLSASNKAEIGRVPDFWEGYLDDFRIYDSDLSESEIYALYSLGKDDRTTYSVVSTDVGSNTMLPFWIASDRLGTNMELTYGESEYANYEPDSSTEGLWHMDESINNACSGGTNDVCDSSSNGNDGAISSSPTIVDGVYGKARDFDGGDDFINIGNKSIADNEANLTVSAWVNTNTTDATHHGVFTENFVVFVGQYGTQVSVYLSSDGLTWTHTSNSMGNLTTGMWHNVVWVKEGVSMKVYIDGILTGTMVAPATLGSTSGNNVIGSTIGGTAEWWDGMLDEIRVDSVARSADEVRQMYEVESRAYPITVSFKADLQSGNLITGSGDTSFSIDERSYGTTDYIENLDVGETIIVKENYGGTTYVAQGQIASINTSTGASTVDSWDSDSTFPTAGFTVNATVFKWQREYVDIRYPLDEDINAVTNLAFRKLTNKGASFWVDDVMRASYFDDSTGASFTPISDIRYVQYESILTRWNNDSTLYVSQVDINYSIVRPTTEQIMRHGKWFKNGEPQGFWWAED
ncbi:DUF2341 domain-containing protein, partial [bacterium]|nr:DUF2341 domain-containing protein [bacterium]